MSVREGGGGSTPASGPRSLPSLIPGPCEGVPPSPVTCPVQSSVAGPAGGYFSPSRARGYPSPSPGIREKEMLRRRTFVVHFNFAGLSAVPLKKKTRIVS